MTDSRPDRNDLQTTKPNLMKMARYSPNGWKTLWEKEKLLVTAFATMISNDVYCRHVKTRVRIHQPFSRTFFVFVSKICKFECNTTSDWLNRTFSQSEVVLHSNASIHRKFWRIRQRTF